MKDYSNYYPSKEEYLKHKAEKAFELHYINSNEDGIATVNGKFKKRVIVKDHTNPMNFALEDKKLYFVEDKENMIRRGDIISGISDRDYIVVTIPETNDYVSKCRVRKMYDSMSFMLDGEKHTLDCVVAKGLLYDATSYVIEKTVFTEEDMIALIVQYNDITSKLNMFSPVVVNNEMYRIVSKDTYRLKEHPHDYGVIQFVLFKTIACVDDNGNVMASETMLDYRFGVSPFKISGILRYAKLKERIYNSKAREIITPHNTIKTGDYIEVTYLRNPSVDDSTETRMYLTQSLIDMRDYYDSAFLIDCNTSFNLKDKDGNAFTVYAYFENNSTQLMANERNSNVFNESSKYKCLVQSNPHTRKLGKEIGRIIIDGDAYTVVGVDKLSAEGLIGVEMMEGKLNPSSDNLDLQIADYYAMDDVIDTTSDADEEDIYKDSQAWTYLLGGSEILLGEQAEFEIKPEPKIVHGNKNIRLLQTEYALVNEDGSVIDENDVYFKQDGLKFYVTSKPKISLLGKVMKLTAVTYFEETVDSGEIREIISVQDRLISIGGW